MTDSKATLSILIVDDNPGDRELANIALEEAAVSAEVHVADHLAGALEQLRSLHPDIVLLDMGLPDTSGMEGLKAVIDRAPFTPIIVLTSLTNPQIPLQALECGAQDYLVKGEYTPDLLARAVRYAVERKRGELALLQAARFDTVTGLINRSYFISLLDHALDRAQRNASEVHLLFVDLDHFKNINDNLGHAAGDTLLREVGERIRGAVRDSDVVARLGGDEFTVLVEDAGTAGIPAIVANKIIHAMQPSFKIAGVDVMMTPSIGIAGFPVAGRDSTTLLQRADTAMYRAKSGGRNCVEFFNDDMGSAVRGAFDLEMALRKGVQDERFELYYQPAIDSQNGNLCSVEALLRWHREGTMEPVEAGAFIPMLENSGLIREVGEWVLRTACAQCREWHTTVQPGLRISVNASAQQIHARGFADTVEQILRETGLAAQYLMIEVTEQVLRDGNAAAIATLGSLRTLGVAVAIDDFGSGFTSLSQLAAFPFDTVKIDFNFVRQLASPTDSELITAGILSVARGLARNVIAKGVENTAQLDFLTAHQCREVQGFHYSRALSAGRFEECYAPQVPALRAPTTTVSQLLPRAPSRPAARRA